MGKDYYYYDVFDIINKIFISKDARCCEIEKQIGIPHNQTSLCCTNGRIFNGQYKIFRKPIVEGYKRKYYMSEIKIKERPSFVEKQKTEADYDFMRRWDKFRLKMNPGATPSVIREVVYRD